MGMKEVVDGIRKAREEAIRCLWRAEYGYAEQEMRKLYAYMPVDFLSQVVGNYNVGNYARVADLLEQLWKTVEVPPNADEVSK